MLKACTAFIVIACVVSGEAGRVSGPATRPTSQNSTPRYPSVDVYGRQLKQASGGQTAVTIQVYSLTFQVQPFAVEPLTTPPTVTTSPFGILTVTNSTPQFAFMDILEKDLLRTLSSKLGSDAQDVQVGQPFCVDQACDNNRVELAASVYVRCNSTSDLDQVMLTTTPPLDLVSQTTASSYGLLALNITPSHDNQEAQAESCNAALAAFANQHQTISIASSVAGAAFMLGYGVVQLVRRRLQQAAAAAGQQPDASSTAAPTGSPGAEENSVLADQELGQMMGAVVYVTPGAAPTTPKGEGYPDRDPPPTARPPSGRSQSGTFSASAPYSSYAMAASGHFASSSGAMEQDPYTAAAAALRAVPAVDSDHISAGRLAEVPSTNDGPVSAGAVTYYKRWGW
jgi:hypothetical protein